MLNAGRHFEVGSSRGQVQQFKQLFAGSRESQHVHIASHRSPLAAGLQTDAIGEAVAFRRPNRDFAVRLIVKGCELGGDRQLDACGGLYFHTCKHDPHLDCKGTRGHLWKWTYDISVTHTDRQPDSQTARQTDR